MNLARTSMRHPLSVMVLLSGLVFALEPLIFPGRGGVPYDDRGFGSFYYVVEMIPSLILKPGIRISAQVRPVGPPALVFALGVAICLAAALIVEFSLAAMKGGRQGTRTPR